MNQNITVQHNAIRYDTKRTPTRQFFFFFRAQILASLAYSRDTEGVHFVNPQAWVTQNLFKQTSIWDIPLMKPRYACAIPNPTTLSEEDALRAEVLERNLQFYRMGGACDSGLVSVDP